MSNLDRSMYIYFYGSRSLFSFIEGLNMTKNTATGLFFVGLAGGSVLDLSCFLPLNASRFTLGKLFLGNHP